MYEQLQLDRELLWCLLPSTPIEEVLLVQTTGMSREYLILDEFYLLWSIGLTEQLRKLDKVVNSNLYKED